MSDGQAEAKKNVEVVKFTIDGSEISAAKGTTILQAALSAGIAIPYYCYHPHLSVVGNCRMCQVEVVGAPKLMIACHTIAQEGMEVRTHHTSEEVRKAQAATLELILINHPLDCTVCDQSGHCKLQDYHFEYNANASRFIESKVHKVKAEPLGPTVILDGERCIMCTRCIRFCDEITGTSEIGMRNRGSHSEICVDPGRPLDNPLSGTVVDLCPVGALTHRKWRFRSRIWFTSEVDTICPGCSTGCNCRVAVRESQVVMVKARLNAAVNKEWMCDEGRYGFERFLPEKRIQQARLNQAPADNQQALQRLAELENKLMLVFVSPDLLLEDYFVLKKYLDSFIKNCNLALAYRQRELSRVESILISPDHAANFRAAEFLRLAQGDLQNHYQDALASLKKGVYRSVLLVGDRAILQQDLTGEVLSALKKVESSAGILCDAESELALNVNTVIPGRSILEKSGLVINRARRLQYAQALCQPPAGTLSEREIFVKAAGLLGKQLVQAENDRALTLEVLRSEGSLKGIELKDVKNGGVALAGSE